MKIDLKTINIILVILIIAALPACSEHSKQELKLINQADKILTDVSKILGQEITRDVKKGFKDREALISILDKMMAEEFPAEKFYAYEQTLKFMDLVPDNMDLQKKLKALYLEQIGGFYNPETKELYLIRAGEIPMLDNPFVQKMIMAHELCHALQDMKTDLDKLIKNVESSDISVAYLSVMEGQAVILMFQYMMNTSSDKLPDLEAMKPMMSSPSGMMGADFKEFENAPRYIKETLALFPYMDGAIFYQKYLKEYKDRDPIEIFDHLPNSSEQIIHFDKYKNRDYPQKITLDNPATLLGADWKMLANEGWGEIDWKLMFEETGAKKTAVDDAAGWDGASVMFYENQKDKDHALVIISTWDTEKDRDEALENYKFILEKKYPEASRHEVNYPLQIRNGSKRSYLLKKDMDLIILEQIPAEIAGTVISKVKNYTKAEIK